MKSKAKEVRKFGERREKKPGINMEKESYKEESQYQYGIIVAVTHKR